MEQKLVTVIITTHNREPMLVLRAFTSVLRQTYQNIEIIVVDDSPDSYHQRGKVECAIYQMAKDNLKKVLYIQHPVNMGACAARNTGLAYAKGYYVSFLDDDDEWLPEKIEEELKGFTDSNIALVYCGCIMIDEVRKTKYPYRTVYKSGYIFHSLLERNFIGGSSNPLLKKECIDAVERFDINMQSGQDYDLWLRIAMRYPVNYVKRQLLNYYIHNGDRISTDLDKKIAGEMRIIDKYGYEIRKRNNVWVMKQRALISLYVQKGWKKKAYSLWFLCVKKTPLYILQNAKMLLLIIFGYDSGFYLAYRKVRLLLSGLFVLKSKRL